MVKKSLIHSWQRNELRNCYDKYSNDLKGRRYIAIDADTA